MTSNSTPFLRTRLTLLVAALAAGSVVYAATMSRADYGTEKDRIAVVFKSERSACGEFSGNQKDICKEKAEGKEKVARAQLEYQYSGKPADANKWAVAKADADFGLAKERCDDKAGNPKDVCVQEARSNHTKALADAKLQVKVGDAMKEADDDKRAANYKVAAEKCDSLGGDTKIACLNDAKARFGKI